MDTCKIICDYSTKDWTKYDLATFTIKEARIDRKALNKKDGGKGLFQITGFNRWWKAEMPWVTNLYSKRQNTKAAIYILEKKKKQYGSKYEAIKRYNGSNKKANKYRQDIIDIKNKLKNV